MLVAKASFEEERVLSIIYHLYTHNNGKDEKNKSYLIAMCKMLLKEERKPITEKNLSLSDYETKFVKIYSVIIKRSKVTMNYFNKLKKYILPIIVHEVSTLIGDNNKNTEMDEMSNEIKQSNFSNKHIDKQDKKSSTYDFFIEGKNGEKKKNSKGSSEKLDDCLKNIISHLFEKLQEDFQKVNINEEIIEVDLVALNAEIYALFRELNNTDSYKFQVKIITVAIFFAKFFDQLLIKDKIWHEKVEMNDHFSERLSSTLQIVINYLCYLFGKDHERGL